MATWEQISALDVEQGQTYTMSAWLRGEIRALCVCERNHLYAGTLYGDIALRTFQRGVATFTVACGARQVRLEKRERTVYRDLQMIEGVIATAYPAAYNPEEVEALLD